MIEDFLLNVMKPARYIGREWNACVTDFEGSRVRCALCFPDLYEIGMSNLGIRILYGVLNAIPGVACERFFSCADDMDTLLREKGLEPVSLESRRPLRDFDFVGFSLGSELCYTNVLRLLFLGNIPLRAQERGPHYPLIIGGGPCTMNPEPMHAFFDMFVIGEAEEAIAEIIAAYEAHKDAYKSGRLNKEDLLYFLSQIEGVYVPSLYEVVLTENAGVDSFKPTREGVPPVVKKRFVKDFNSVFFPVDWIVPYIQVVHDRISLEVMRGCPNRCRFCQARSQYAPVRIRTAETVMRLARQSYACTGYEEISLCGLSVSDYPYLGESLKELIGFFKSRAVGISLPSVKARAMLGDLFSLIASIKKSGLTFAPEAGSERLRVKLAKDFEEGVFFEALERAYAGGYQHVKLYFMIGLPQETDEDLDGIIEFSTRVSELRRKIAQSPAQVNISINTFIPKPHTPFQWYAMDTPETVRRKQEYLRKKLKNRRLQVSFHNHSMSFLEAVLSRGDRRLSDVIMRACDKGARFDAWSDQFVYERWEEAFKEAGIDPYSYLQARSPDESLPWDFIDVCVDKEALRQEYLRSKA